MKSIFLIGFMASGKTTLGRALAAAMPGVRFIDLDEAIEAEAGRSVADIFADEGEAAFRRIESDVLRKVSHCDSIIACGGGTPCRPENMDFMLEVGSVIYLTATSDRIVQRLQEAPPGRRPLVDALLDNTEKLKEYVDNMIATRECYYKRAHHTFDANRLDTKEQIDTSVKVLRHVLCRRTLKID